MTAKPVPEAYSQVALCRATCGRFADRMERQAKEIFQFELDALATGPKVDAVMARLWEGWDDYTRLQHMASAIIVHNNRALNAYLEIFKRSCPDAAARAPLLNARAEKPVLMHTALFCKNLGALRLLVEAGVSVTLRGTRGYALWEPLTGAAFWGLKEATQLIRSTSRDASVDRLFITQALLQVLFAKPESDTSPFAFYLYLSALFRLHGAAFFHQLNGSARSTVQSALDFATQSRSVVEQARAAREQDLLILPIGFRGHSMGLVFYTPRDGLYRGITIMAICDRGYSQGAHGSIVFYHVDRKKLNESQFQILQNCYLFDHEGPPTIAYLHRHLPASLAAAPSRDSELYLRELRQTSMQLELGPQERSDCTAASAMAAVMASHILITTANNQRTDGVGPRCFFTRTREEVANDCVQDGCRNRELLLTAYNSLTGSPYPPGLSALSPFARFPHEARTALVPAFGQDAGAILPLIQLYYKPDEAPAAAPAARAGGAPPA